MPLPAPDQDKLDQDERALTRAGRITHEGQLRHWFLLLASVVVVLSACSSGGGPRATGSSPVGSAKASTDPGADRDGPVDIGDGREIYLECHGTGSPTVVLVSGLGDSAEIWSTAPDQENPTPSVYGDVAKFTRVCAYDRPGTSGSRFFDGNTVVTELRQSPPVPDVPVTVLTADVPQLTPQLLASGQLPPGVDQEFADALWAAQMAAQNKLPAKFQHAVHITNTRSDHYVQLGNPRLVIDSILEIVDDVRSRERSR